MFRPKPYADVAGLVEASTIVAAVEVRQQAVVEAARAPGLAAGHARLYLEGRTLGVLWGRAGLGQEVAFLADVALLPNGKPPKLTKQRLKRGVFHSLVSLQAAINRYVDQANDDPRPFRWTKDPDKIIAAVRRGHQLLDSLH